jgi:hypothetical protein
MGGDTGTMIETIVSGMSIVTCAGIGVGVWYKLGKLENKVDFIYKNVNVAMSWANGKTKRK